MRISSTTGINSWHKALHKFQKKRQKNYEECIDIRQQQQTTTSLQWASDKCSCPLKIKVTLWTNLFKLNIKTRGSGNLLVELLKCCKLRASSNSSSILHHGLPIFSLQVGLNMCLNLVCKIQHSSGEFGFHLIVLLKKFIWRHGIVTQAHRDWGEVRERRVFAWMNV